MNKIEQTLTSLEVAEMVGRRHDQVLRDIRTIIKHISDDHKSVAVKNYFIATSYMDAKGEERDSYLLTKKGCELYATRMTGEKGTKFAVAYIERFNEMEQHIEKQVPQMSQAEIIAAVAQQNVEQERRIAAVEEKQENITQIISLNNSKKWRDDVNKIINTIARNNGGSYRQTRTESYARLETRAKADLEARLRNKVRRLKENGATKKVIDNANYLDVIADDVRLIEIYLSVVKEMAVENGIERTH